MPERTVPGAGIGQLGAIVPNQEMLPVFLVLMLAAAIAWLFLVHRLYKALRQNHPDMYKKLGSPQLFKKKAFAANLLLFRFLFRPAASISGDPAIARLCGGLRALFCMYVICLAGCLLLLLGKIVP